jgi:hypothetical protein
MTPARRRDRGEAAQGRINGRGITRSAQVRAEDRGYPLIRRSFPCAAGGAAPPALPSLLSYTVWSFGANNKSPVPFPVLRSEILKLGRPTVDPDVRIQGRIGDGRGDDR